MGCRMHKKITVCENVIHLSINENETHIQRMKTAVRKMEATTAAVVADLAALNHQLARLDDQMHSMSNTLERCNDIYTTSIQKLISCRISLGNNST